MAQKVPQFEVNRVYRPDMDKMVKALRVAAGIDKPKQRVQKSVSN